MYLPGLIFTTYVYFASKKIKQDQLPSYTELVNILQNLFISEVMYFISYMWLIPFSNFSLFNLLAFSLVQDVYFYFVHFIFHRYLYFIHKQHHGTYGPMHAWHCSWIEQIILNLGSVGIPFMLFPNPSWLFALDIFVEIYTSINGHTNNSEHQKHHLDITKRFGSIYIVDRIMGTY